MGTLTGSTRLMPVPLTCPIVEMAPASSWCSSSCCAHPVYMLSLCLEIEALEHGYLLPALVQVAHYRASYELAVARYWRPEARDGRGCCASISRHSSYATMARPGCSALGSHNVAASTARSLHRMSHSPDAQGQPIAHSMRSLSEHGSHRSPATRSSSDCLIRAVRACPTISSAQPSLSRSGWSAHNTGGDSASVPLARAPATSKPCGEAMAWYALLARASYECERYELSRHLVQMCYTAHRLSAWAPPLAWANQPVQANKHELPRSTQGTACLAVAVASLHACS